jgi:nitrate reductase gamma subunit
VGIVAGYILPFSLLLILILRVSKSKDRYTSIYNYFLTGLLFVISLTGLLMRNFFHPDLIDVMDFIMGIVTFRPEALPESFLFVLHFSLFLLLVPYIPLHLFTAPLVTMEAQRREQGLDMVLHEK